MSDTPKYRSDSKTKQSQSGLFEAPVIQEGHSGHRQRLRARFLNGGADAMPDYELLELVLFRALPRRDTKGISKRLLARFGSFADVINAPDDQLKEVTGVGESVVSELKLVRAAAVRLGKSQLSNRPILSSWNEVITGIA